MRKVFLQIILVILLCVGCKESPPQDADTKYLIEKCISSNNKNSIIWAKQFLADRGMSEVKPIDFSRSRKQEQPKINQMLEFWKALPNKEELDRQFHEYCMSRSPMYPDEWK